MSERLVAVHEGGICRDPAGRWVVRPYRPGDEGQILDLFRRVFGVDRSLDHWRWKFQTNPVGHFYMRVAETPSGELVGQYAGLPVRVAWGERTLIFTQIIDVMVDRRYRLGLKRPGLFSVLATEYIGDYLVSGRVPIGYGFPTPEALRIGQRIAGYVPLHPVVRLVLDLGRTRQQHGLENPEPFWARFLRRNSQRPRSVWRFRVEPVDRFGAEADQLWEQVKPELPVATVRDARYLNWRYVECPDVKYTSLVARRRFDGGLTGIAVLRLGVADQPIACLMDWLVPRGAASVAQPLLARCETLAREAGMTELQAWFPPHAWPYHLLLDRHYRPEPTSYHLVALTKVPDVSLEWVKGKWYTTMGDSDIY